MSTRQNNSSLTDEQRMNDMFGADFDPSSRSRVLDVIYIEQTKKRLAQENIDAIDSRHKKNLELQDAKL